MIEIEILHLPGIQLPNDLVRKKDWTIIMVKSRKTPEIFENISGFEEEVIETIDQNLISSVKAKVRAFGNLEEVQQNHDIEI